MASSRRPATRRRSASHASARDHEGIGSLARKITGLAEGRLSLVHVAQVSLADAERQQRTGHEHRVAHLPGDRRRLLGEGYGLTAGAKKLKLAGKTGQQGGTRRTRRRLGHET